MTKVSLQKHDCLQSSGDLIVCEVDDRMNPVGGTAEVVWKAAGEGLIEFREKNDELPLQECSLQISSNFKLKQFKSIAHIFIPRISDPTSLTTEEKEKFKNCYDNIFSSAKYRNMKKVVLPFLGKVRAGNSPVLSDADAVDIAFRAAFDAIRRGDMEGVEEIQFVTTIKDVYNNARAHESYSKRKELNNKSTTNIRNCTIGESNCLPVKNGKCNGVHTRLLSLIGNQKTLDLLGCSHEADLIMSRIGKFSVKWDSEEAANYDICDLHLNILLIDWRNPFYRNIKTRDGNVLCSFPEHHGTRPAITSQGTLTKQLVTKADSERWMRMKKTILAVGTPLCDEDIVFLRSAEFDTAKGQHEFKMRYEKWTDGNAGTFPKKSESTVEAALQEAVKNFLIELNGGSNVDRRKNWDDLSPRQQREKVRMANSALDTLCEVLAPDAKEELRRRVVNGGIVPQYENCAPFKKLLTDVAELYARATTKMHKIFVLASVASVPLPVLQQFIPDLTPHYHKKARMVQLKGSINMAKNVGPVRYDEAKLNKLLEFILSPYVVLDLPFDERQEKMDDGSSMSMPNLMRLQTIDEVYRMYLAYLEEEGISQMALKETTAKYIIKLVAPTRRKNLTCVDEKIADGQHAFDELFNVVNELQKKDIIKKDPAAKLIKDLQLSRSYLRGDFKVHVKVQSTCADHCATFALSDPNSPCFANDCSTGSNPHNHDIICERCANVDSTLQQIKTLLESAQNSAKTSADKELFSILNEECDIHRDAIYEMKKHQVRASLSHQERAEFIDGLADDEALVTLDWAQKLTPFYAREKQVEYYAKSGIAYHISHALTKKNGEEAEHLSIHIFQPGEKQDGTAVSLIVEAFLLELKQMGIKRVLIRSDCAGCYRNAPLVSSLAKLQTKVGVIIDGLLFSEAQAGKGPCDRGSARTKGKARDQVTTTRGKIETKEDFFNALIAGKLLNGVSVHLCSISKKKNVNSKIANITSYSSFDFEGKGVRLRRHDSIGDGLLLDLSRVSPCEGQLKIIRSGGHTVDSGDLFWLSKKSHQARSSTSNTTVPTPMTSSGVLHCTEENCIAEFRSFHQFQRHLNVGTHKYELERKTMHDYCTEMASLSLSLNASSSQVGQAASGLLQRGVTHLNQGWALREVKKRNPDDQPARELIKEFFEERTKKQLKVNPHDAEQHMKNARNPDGSIMIAPKNRLTMTQIKSMISGLLKKGKKSTSNSSKDEIDSLDESCEDLDESDDEDVLRALVLSHKDVLFETKKKGTDTADQPKRKRKRNSMP